ncbi:unnamed protein product, partial [Iphiclides podalirius]
MDGTEHFVHDSYSHWAGFIPKLPRVLDRSEGADCPGFSCMSACDIERWRSAHLADSVALLKAFLVSPPLADWLSCNGN